MDEKYVIYSGYLQVVNKGYIEHIKENCVFVVKAAPTYEEGVDEDIAQINISLNDWKTYTRNINNEAVKATLGLFWWKIPDSLKKDTLWFPLMDRLLESMKKKHYVKNSFTSDLHVSLLTYNDYTRYFDGHSYDWGAFKENFGRYSELVDFSDVISDGKRAIFFCTEHYHDLGGSGNIVFFYKDASGWKYAGIWSLWMS